MPPRRDTTGTVRVATGAPAQIALPTRLPTKKAPVQRKLGTVLGQLVPTLTSEDQLRFNDLPVDPGVDLTMLIAQQIQTEGPAATIAYLQEGIAKGWDNATLLFSNPLLRAAHEKEQRDIEIHRQKIRSSAGVFQCPKCGSRETVSVEKQIRSADEPKTILITCLACGHNWRRG